jgi:ABC-type polysaccharide/polyol phosphate transport system ATPase subunit
VKPILEIQSISKKYRIQHLTGGYVSLRERMMNAFKFERDLEEDFWALDSVSFSVQPGESIGIIGRNGAGKSTLLKILSKITPPSTGRIVSRGRIASLLEVGTGFHPELTGRENIFFNGSLLGMKHREIETKFDEIVSFSGVDKFLDTPLKHYSSGMQLRLAFAVAAFLEPEILIIDEVLAVGDAEFQKKCIGKMEDVSKSGRTILFVSHNLPSLKTICKRGILLEKGKIIADQDIDTVVHQYTSAHIGTRNIMEGVRHLREGEKVNFLKINGMDHNKVVVSGNKLRIQTNITLTRKINFELQVHIKRDDEFLASYANFVKGNMQAYESGTYTLNYEIQLPEIRSGNYVLDVYFTEPFVTWFANSLNDIEIEIVNEDHHLFLNSQPFHWWGTVLLNGKMDVSKIED